MGGAHFYEPLLRSLMTILHRTSDVILDQHRRVFVSLVGFPRDNPNSKPWMQVARDASQVISTTCQEEGITSRRHRRGNFAALATGVSYGGGQLVSLCLRRWGNPDKNCLSETWQSLSANRGCSERNS